MSKNVHHVIVYSFQGIRDPLFRGLILQYLKKVNANKAYHFHIITHEQSQYEATEDEQKQFREAFSDFNISWHPVQYHTGRFLLFKKLYDFLHSFWIAFKIKRKYKINVLFGYLTIAGAFSYIISRVLGMKLVIYCFEPHSDYMLDFGTWSSNSIKYKLLNYFERLEATKSEYLVVPTSHTLKLVKSWRSQAKKIFKVPISIDTEKFHFCPEKRVALREKYNFGTRKVILYLGKFGGIYYDEKQVGVFLKQMLDYNPDFFVFVISPNPKSEIKDAFLDASISADDVLILPKVPYEEVENYISCADLGLVAIPPLPSQKYRTPVKVGNYLACGLPYLITRGIADDDTLAEQHQVGVVFDTLEAKDFEKSIPQLQEILDEDVNTLRQRCRDIAIQERGLHNTENALREIFEAIF